MKENKCVNLLNLLGKYLSNCAQQITEIENLLDYSSESATNKSNIMELQRIDFVNQKIAGISEILLFIKGNSIEHEGIENQLYKAISLSKLQDIRDMVALNAKPGPPI